MREIEFLGRREREFFLAPFPHVAKREKEGKFDSYENARRCAVEFVLTHATKQEFSVYEQIGKRMNMDFPNIEIQEGECGGGERWLGNTETRNVWQPLVPPPPPNTKIRKQRNTRSE